MNGVPGLIPDAAERVGHLEGSRTLNAYDREIGELNAIENDPGSSDAKKEHARMSFTEKLLKSLQKTKGKWDESSLAYLFTVLGLNWIYKTRYRAKEAFTKGKLEVLKLRVDEMKAEYFREELWKEEVKKTHENQMAKAFFGYTGGAIKEIGKLSNYAFHLDEVDIRVPLDRKEVVSGLVEGDHSKALSLRELAIAYNDYFDNEENGLEALKKRNALKSEYDKYGFSRNNSRKIDLDKENITLPELASLGVWLFGQKNSANEPAPNVGKNKTINGIQIADSDEYRKQWEFALGFDKRGKEGLVYGSRDLWQKWLMWHLKTPGILQEGATRNTGSFEDDPLYGQKALAQYQHDDDYYHRSLSMAVGGQIGRAQMDSRQEQSELLKDFSDSMNLTHKQEDGEDLTPQEQERLDEANERIKEQIDKELKEEDMIRKVVEPWVEQYVLQQGYPQAPRDRTKAQNNQVNYMTELLVKKLQQKWAIENKKRPVANARFVENFEEDAFDFMDEYDFHEYEEDND